MTIRTLSLIALFLVSLALTPLASAQAVVDVVTYGAIPDDGVDDIDAINAAIAALPQGTPCTLKFHQGTYDISPSLSTVGPPAPLGATGPDKKPIFKISNMSGLTIEGNGATLLCHEFDPTAHFFQNYYDLFRIENSEYVTVQDLTVNMSRLPFSVGNCNGINWQGVGSAQNYFQVVMHADFRPMTAMHIQALSSWRNGNPAGQIFDYLQQWPVMRNAQGNSLYDFVVSSNVGGVTLQIKGNVGTTAGRGLWSYPGYEMISELGAPPPAPDPLVAGRLQPGDDVVFAHAYRLYSAFEFEDCSNSLLSNLTVYSWPGKAVRMLQDLDAVIDGLQVLPDPQRVHVISTTGEGMVLRNMKGNLRVQNCNLEGMLHDGVNVYTDLLPKATAGQPLAPAIDVEAASVLASSSRAIRIFPAGSTWEFYDANMVPLGTGTLSVASANPNPVFPAPQTHRLTFVNLSVALKASTAFVCLLDESPFTDVDSLAVIGNHGNGLLVRRDANVVGGFFAGVSGSGVKIGPSIGSWVPLINPRRWYPDYIPALGPYNTGPSGKDVLVDESHFVDCSRGAGLLDYSEGTIHIQTSIFTEQTNWVIKRSSGIHGSIKDVTLRWLEILNSGGATIVNRSVDTVTIEDCLLGPCNDLGYLLSPILPLGAGRFAGESLIFSHNASDLLIQNNQATASPAYLYPDRVWAPMYGFYKKINNVGF